MEICNCPSAFSFASPKENAGSSEPASPERATAMRGVSYPLSPFPPLQIANASLVCNLRPGGISISLRASLNRPEKPLRFSGLFPRNLKQPKISDAPKAPLELKGPIPPIRGNWPEGPIGVGTLSAKRTEGIRTLQISEHSEIYTRSPPSFSPKMPPPLIMQGMTRGGFSGYRLGFSQASFSSFSLAFFSAFASWSGQEVSFMPQ